MTIQTFTAEVMQSRDENHSAATRAPYPQSRKLKKPNLDNNTICFVTQSPHHTCPKRPIRPHQFSAFSNSAENFTQRRRLRAEPVAVAAKSEPEAKMRSRKSKLPIQRRRAGAETVKIEKLTAVAAATKVRTRIRKPRYASLTKLDRKDDDDDDDDELEMRLIDLFPILTAAAAAAVPTAAVEDHMSVSRISEYFFSDECDSLTGLLDSEEAISLSIEVSPMFERIDRDENLVKAALRSRERDESKEKWVSYSEVVEDVSSSAVDGCGRKEDEDEEETRVMKLKRLSLKLDYQEVLDAWDGERSLFVNGGECAQIVPCFDDDEFFAGDSNGVWCVPDQKAKKMTMIKNEECMMMNLEDDELKWKMGQMREASLLRYKEKRRNRLFSKRIRYEVRKLNAEKRPRIKGRFVKRD